MSTAATSRPARALPERGRGALGLDTPRAWTIAQIAVPLLFGLWSLLLGVDANWDLYNYHLYNPFALLHGKLAVDLAPAGLQSYFNPALDLPYYLLNLALPAPVVGFLMGAVHGSAFVLLLGIARRLLPDLAPEDRYRVPLLLALAGSLTPNFLSELGNSMGDNATALFVLASLLLVLDRWPHLGTSMPSVSGRERARWTRTAATLALAGVVAGLGVGLKPTNGPYALALCSALLAAPAAWRLRLGYALAFGVGVLLGFAATAGYWLLEMWQVFGNPLFPQFSAHFPNPLTRSLGVADLRWLPRDWGEKLLWPFVFALDPGRVSQVPMRLVLWPIAYALVVWWAVAALVRRSRGSPDAARQAVPVRFVVVFAATAYLVWMQLFSVSRYLVPLEMILPLLLFVILADLVSYRAARGLAAASIGTATLLVVAGGYVTWGHKGWDVRAFSAELPPLQQPERVTAVLLGEEPPWGWLVTQFPASVAFVQLGGNFPEGPAFAARVHAMTGRPGRQAFAIFRAHSGRRPDSAGRTNGLLGLFGVTRSERGCAALRWAVTTLGSRRVVQAPEVYASRPGVLCELARRNPPPQRDASADNRREEETAAKILARYGLAFVPERCSMHRARIGREEEPYRWCPVVRR